MISIVIPLYNKEKSITATLESVLAQTYTDYEVIVVDDGSTDHSANIVRELANVKIRLICKSNGGVCSARNRGIEEAKGEYIALLDGDDFWDKDYLAEQVRMIEDFPEAAMWGINYAETNNGKLIRRLTTGLPDGYRGYVENYFMIQNRSSDLFCSSSVVIRRDVFDKVGLFDERIKYAEDSDMWFRIIASEKVAFYDKYMVYYQWDAENRTMNKHREMRYFLPYYVDKYKEPLFKRNKIFYQWVMRWAAVRIKLAYFNSPTQQKVAKEALRKLDFSQLPIKYRLELLTPFWIGKQVYKLLK